MNCVDPQGRECSWTLGRLHLAGMPGRQDDGGPGQRYFRGSPLSRDAPADGGLELAHKAEMLPVV